MHTILKSSVAAGAGLALLAACAGPSYDASSGASGSQGSGTASGAPTEAHHTQSIRPGLDNTDAGPAAVPNEGERRGDRR